MGVEGLEDVAREQRVVDSAVFVGFERWERLLSYVDHFGGLCWGEGGGEWGVGDGRRGRRWYFDLAYNMEILEDTHATSYGSRAQGQRRSNFFEELTK